MALSSAEAPGSHRGGHGVGGWHGHNPLLKVRAGIIRISTHNENPSMRSKSLCKGEGKCMAYLLHGSCISSFQSA